MTKRQKEIIKFFLKPIWLPLAVIGEGLKRVFLTFLKELIGDDAMDAWGAFVTVSSLGSIILLMSAMMIGFRPLLIYIIMIVIGYFVLFYFRDYKKRVKKNGTE